MMVYEDSDLSFTEEIRRWYGTHAFETPQARKISVRRAASNYKSYNLSISDYVF